MICPFCKIGKAYIESVDKTGKPQKLKCIICEKKWKVENHDRRKG